MKQTKTSKGVTSTSGSAVLKVVASADFGRSIYERLNCWFGEGLIDSSLFTSPKSSQELGAPGISILQCNRWWCWLCQVSGSAWNAGLAFEVGVWFFLVLSWDEAPLDGRHLYVQELLELHVSGTRDTNSNTGDLVNVLLSKMILSPLTK